MIDDSEVSDLEEVDDRDVRGRSQSELFRKKYRERFRLFDRTHLIVTVSSWKRKKEVRGSVVIENYMPSIIRENEFFGKEVRYLYKKDKYSYAENITPVKLELCGKITILDLVAKSKRPREQSNSSFANEVRISLREDIRHENIVNYIKVVYEGRSLEASEKAYLIMDNILPGAFMEPIKDSSPLQWKTFLDFEQSKHFFTMEELIEYMIPVAKALEHIHDLNIAHLDMKPMNIFMWKFKPNKYVPKLGDFGLSLEVDETGVVQRMEHGTAGGFTSPERQKQETFDPFKDDVWGLGVVMFTAITKSTLLDPMRKTSNIPVAELKSTLKNKLALYPLLKKICDYSADDRPDITETLDMLKNYKPRPRQNILC